MMRSQFASTCNRDILLVLGRYYQKMHLGVARFARQQHWHVTFDFDEPIPPAWNNQGMIVNSDKRTGDTLGPIASGWPQYQQAEPDQ